MNATALVLQDEIKIGPLTAGERREYGNLGRLERALDEMVRTITETSDRDQERELRKLRGPLEAAFRMRVSRLVKCASARYLRILDTFPASEWEVGVNKGHVVVFRKDAVVRRI